MKTRFLLAPAACIALALATTLPGAEAANAEPSRYTVHLVKVGVGVLAEQVGLATGKTFIIDPRVKGLVTLETESPLSATELYESFVRVLSGHGLGVTKHNGAILIAPNTAPRSVPRTSMDGSITI